ncbi:BLUF domain-containing protein [Polynucleobacter sp. AP-Nino-20-G2]|uniref:BLUF domain-containing protein n=1 Tax=Polynucleobacter sp. AP-Nino-20-G2 TaxID=2576917 RepID=UPI001BFD9179|nr:BLUF domain-containing protein [Polynucleobacter sp. AP-Nino-20-G2]QWE16225.1 BLUF domain-containing protein [Polynucleobacter sp. AP-Nino-20-G2]
MSLEKANDLVELSYVSKATHEMGLTSLVHLFDVSRQWNQEHQLTGVLFYENGHFGQILEGKRDDVLFIWEKIKKDYRHKVLHQIALDEIKQRLFPHWALRFYGGDQIAKDVPHLAGVLDGLPANDVELLSIMRSVASNNQYPET